MSMKVCIIGAGIAGLAAAIFLKDAGLEVFLFEKGRELGLGGYGFLLLENGIDVLKKAGLYPQIYLNSDEIKQIALKNEKGILINHQSISEAFAIRRKSLSAILSSRISESIIKTNHQFSHFLYDNHGIATQACFTNGAKIEADIFIGADGTRSLVRNSINSNFQLPPVRIKELVSSVNMSLTLDSTLTKFQDSKGGLAAGFIPIGKDIVNWYMQFDSKRWDLNDSTNKKQFARALVGHFPEPFPTFVKKTNFENSHIWHTTNMHTLPKFHDKNILIIGDAAHTFSPFSSQGVNTALQDAFILGEIFAQSSNWDTCFELYASKRIPSILSFMKAGEEMIHHFVTPNAQPFIPLAIEYKKRIEHV